jgi:hypothetical protein
MKFLLMLACALLAVGGSPFAQSQSNDQVEVKTDRFSEATTIKLKPQTILDTPDQLITMSLEAKFGDKKIRSEMDQAAEIMGEGATIRFKSQTKKPSDFGDRELHFIVDGKQVKVGESSGRISQFPADDPDLKPGFKIIESFVNTLDAAQLKQIAGGNRVEMRLGKFEFALNAAVLGNVREFVREFAKRAPSSKLKEKRP